MLVCRCAVDTLILIIPERMGLQDKDLKQRASEQNKRAIKRGRIWTATPCDWVRIVLCDGPLPEKAIIPPSPPSPPSVVRLIQHYLKENNLLRILATLQVTLQL